MAKLICWAGVTQMNCPKRRCCVSNNFGTLWPPFTFLCSHAVSTRLFRLSFTRFPQREYQIHTITLMFTIHVLPFTANGSLTAPIAFTYSLQHTSSGHYQGKTPWVDSACADCLVFSSWVLLLPRLPPSSRSLRLFPWASLLLHGPLDICLDLLPAAPLPPVQIKDAQHKFLQHKGGTRQH